jgi:hypothetical protein
MHGPAYSTCVKSEVAYLDDLRSLEIPPSWFSDDPSPMKMLFLTILQLHVHLGHPITLIQSRHLRRQLNQFAATV